MKQKFLNLLILIFVFSFLIFPLVVLAAEYLPLVPCGLKAQPSSGGIPNWNYVRPCTRCDAFKLAENVIDFILKGVIPPVAAVLFVYAGLMILLGGAMPKRIEHGKTVFKNTFIGLLIILASWLIVNTFIQSFGPEQVKGGSWFSFTCQNSVITPGGPSGPVPPPSALCSNPAGLAQQNNVPFPSGYPNTKGVNAPELNRLISCVNSRLGSFIDQSQIYTYELTNPLCNFTRGQPICGNCAHRVNSCHYGGPSGSSGSLAVDFNAQGISEQDLFNRLSAIRNECSFGFILFETNHTHVSTPSCIGDTGGN